MAPRSDPAPATPWEAYPRWRQAAGSLADFVQAMPFLGDFEPPGGPPAHPAAPRLAQSIDARAAAGDSAVFLDAPPRLGLAAGIRLRRRGWLVVPFISRWPAPGAVLPVERVAGWLTHSAPAGFDVGQSPLRVCFLLDAERSRRVSARTLRRRFDNRYDYGSYALPPPVHLTACGLTRALWIGPSAGAPPDLEAYADILAAAGISAEFVSEPTLRHSTATSL